MFFLEPMSFVFAHAFYCVNFNLEIRVRVRVRVRVHLNLEKSEKG
jgi:hypothetical protein